MILTVLQPQPLDAFRLLHSAQSLGKITHVNHYKKPRIHPEPQQPFQQTPHQTRSPASIMVPAKSTKHPSPKFGKFARMRGTDSEKPSDGLVRIAKSREP